MNMNDAPLQKEDPGLTIAGKTYRSRLLVGSGKYKDLDETR
ncbi:MAG: thiazole synthase, partial [Herbaspirillum sp.]|nr:thiazole synthase [Herbaspirillum sp.]